MPNTPTPISRRRFITGATLIGAALASGAAWLGLRPQDREVWVEGVLRRNLPGVSLDPDSLATFVRQFAQARQFADRRMRIAVRMDQTWRGLARWIPKSERVIERLERLAVSEYLLGSNFFRVADPRQETIVYSGPVPACGNPFAVFRNE